MILTFLALSAATATMTAGAMHAAMPSRSPFRLNYAVVTGCLVDLAAGVALGAWLL